MVVADGETLDEVVLRVDNRTISVSAIMVVGTGLVGLVRVRNGGRVGLVLSTVDVIGSSVKIE